MTIDWSLRFTDIVSIAAFLFAGFSGILVVKNDMKVLALKFGFLEETVKTETEKQNSKIDRQSIEITKFAELLTLMGRYEERMSTMRKHIDELRRGIGYIIPPPHMQNKED